jgi:hypothetical protein
LEIQFYNALQGISARATVPPPSSKRALFVGRDSSQRKYSLPELDSLVDSLVAQGSLTDRIKGLYPTITPDSLRYRVRQAVLVFYRNGQHFVDMGVLAGAVTDRLGDEKTVEEVTWSGDPDKHVKIGEVVNDPTSVADSLATHPSTMGHPERGRFTAALSGFLSTSAIEELWLLTVQGVDWANRPGLTKEEKKKNPYYPELAKRMKEALVVPQGERLALWSGGYDVSMYAQERGFFTLEVTRAGKVYDQLKLFKNFAPLGELWNQISREFVVHGQDEVHVFLRVFDPSSVLFREELPTILKLNEVTDVRWHLLTGKTLKDLSELDDQGRRVASFTFDSYQDLVAQMPLDAIRNDEVTKNRVAKDLSSSEQQQLKDDVALDRQIFAGIEPGFRGEVQSRVDMFELEQSYNDNADELREKKDAVEAVVRPMLARLRNGLRYDDDLRHELDRKFTELSRRMDAKYPRRSAVEELRRHARGIAGPSGWEPAVEEAITMMKAGTSLEMAKQTLTQLLQVRQ